MPSPHPGSVSPKAHTTRQPPPTNTLTSTHAPTPGGAERLEFFKRVVSVPNAQKTTLAWSFSAFHRSELWVALITFLYLDFLDATGGARAPSGQGPSAGQHRFEHPRVLAPPPQHRSTPGTHLASHPRGAPPTPASQGPCSRWRRCSASASPGSWSQRPRASRARRGLPHGGLTQTPQQGWVECPQQLHACCIATGVASYIVDDPSTKPNAATPSFTSSTPSAWTVSPS